MAYSLVISERAEQQIDRCIGYLTNILKNPSAALSVLEDLQETYDKLENIPESFAYCEEPYLSVKGYRKILLHIHDYILIYRVEDHIVYLVGFFHILENYQSKL